jgi:hypothetical protein
MAKKPREGMRAKLLSGLKGWVEEAPEKPVVAAAGTGRVLTRQAVYDAIERRSPLGRELMLSLREQFDSHLQESLRRWN